MASSSVGDRLKAASTVAIASPGNISELAICPLRRSPRLVF
ncbi:hypothetical protein ACQ4N7_25785 [Nodosilinea sp. AN01ver1]